MAAAKKPRSIWNGTLTFAAVAIPVKLHTATESKTVSFREVHLDDGAPVEHRRFCSKEDKEVPKDEVVKGYETANGKFVVVEKEELDAAAGSSAHHLEVEHFVEAADIDPVFFAKTYYLGAGDGGEDAYRLLREALEKTGRAAIGRFTFHNREYLAAIRPYEDALAVHTLRFADEIVDPAKDLDVPKAGKKPDAREVKMAGQLVETLHDDFDPGDYEDEHRQVVLDAVKRKAKGEDVEAPDDAGGEDGGGDLLAALEASLTGAKG